jgi:plastocyanin
MFFKLLSVGLLAIFVAATPVHKPNVYGVSVGANGKLAYDPEYITGAQPGDIVKFTLLVRPTHPLHPPCSSSLSPSNPKNHTVTQSAFENPCLPNPDVVPINSGLYGPSSRREKYATELHA